MDEELVPQVDDEADTEPMDIPTPTRAVTHSEWPPTPPPPAEEELAQGTDVPHRNAAIYAAVKRPVTSS